MGWTSIKILKSPRITENGGENSEPEAIGYPKKKKKCRSILEFDRVGTKS